jgi:YVTN family beta-propeller protein
VSGCRRLFWVLFLTFTALGSAASEGIQSEAAKPVYLTVKLFPQNTAVLAEGGELTPHRVQKETRTYRLSAGLTVLTLSSPGYHEKIIRLSLEGDFYLEEKLERADSRLLLAGETPTGTMPKSVVFTEDGSRLVVPLLAEKGIDVVPREDLSRRRRVELTPPEKKWKGYVEPAVLRSRNEIWVSQMDTGQVHILDADNFTHKQTVDVKGRWSKVIAFSHDEKRAFVSNWLSEDVSVIDTETRTVLSLVPVSGVPRGMAAGKDGKFLYVCIFDTGNIDKIDLNDLKVVKTLKFGPGAKRHIVLDDEKGVGYVSDMATGRVTSFSLADDRIIKSLWAGYNLNTLTMSADGRFLFVSSRGRNNPETYLKKGPDFGKITVIHADSLTVADWTWGRNQPTGLAVSPDGRFIAFTDFLDDNLEVYDISGLYAD